MQDNKSREGKKKNGKGSPSLHETHSSGNYDKDQKFTKEQKLVVEEKEAESAQTSQTAVSDLNASSMKRYDSYVHSQPIIDPVWR